MPEPLDTDVPSTDAVLRHHPRGSSPDGAPAQSSGAPVKRTRPRSRRGDRKPVAAGGAVDAKESPQAE